MAAIRDTKFVLEINQEELRILVYHLSPEGSFLHERAKDFLPENHEEMTEELCEMFRVAHDRRKFCEQ